MEPDDESTRVTGVVIISLPPPDNPCLGKTITAFTLTGDDYHQPQQTGQLTQTHQENHLPVRPSPPPTRQSQFLPSQLSLGSPRKLVALACISLFAVISFRPLFSSTVRQELKRSNDHDDQKTQTFIFPLYHKFRMSEASERDLEHRLQRLVYKENLVASSDTVIGPRRINRLASLHAAAASVESSSIFPVRGNVYPDGLYFTYVLVGSPPRPYFVDIDTGSDLTWIQCDAPCTSCAKGANALYKPRRANIVPPKELLCMEVQGHLKQRHCETCQQCDYEIEYADHSSSMGVLAKDELHLVTSNGSMAKLDFIFGCAYDQRGSLLNTLAKTDGIIGLSKGRVSLPSQLASHRIIINVVGHCLTADVDGGGYMFLGDEYVPRWGMAWVPMLESSSMEFYSADVMKLNYGNVPLSLGGQNSRVTRVVFDSGSSYTYFTKEAFSELVTTLEEVSSPELIKDTSDPTLPICWRAQFPIRSVADVKQFFKTLTFQFGNKWLIISKKFRIPPEGYLTISKKGNVCLGILDGSKVHGGSTIILGDISLRGQLIVYDNMNKRIGWGAPDCVMPERFKSFSFFDTSPSLDG